jgi:hypothetical protein
MTPLIHLHAARNAHARILVRAQASVKGLISHAHEWDDGHCRRLRATGNRSPENASLFERDTQNPLGFGIDIEVV